jgi:flagellar motor switch protein FliM
MQTILPASMVEPIRFLRDAGQANTSDADSLKWRTSLQEDVQDANVLLRAVLAETQISLRDLTSAKPGDIIPTEMPATVQVFAGDQPVVEGTFGVFQGQNAVRVSKLINRRMLGEKYGRLQNT